MSDDEITKIICANCGHRQSVGANGGKCLICGRAFSAVQKVAHVKRISQTHVSFAAIAGAICDKLEQRNTQIYLAMAKEGRELELTFQRWSVDPPENDERVKALGALSDWQRASLDLLTER